MNRTQAASRRVVQRVTNLRTDLREEREQRRADHTRKVTSALARTSDAACDRIEHVMRAALDDVKAAVLNTNVLTEPFIAEIASTVRSTSTAVNDGAK